MYRTEVRGNLEDMRDGMVVQKRQSATVAKFCCVPVAPTNPAVAPANAPPQFPYKVERQEGDACTTKISDGGTLSLLHNLSIIVVVVVVS
ncbi:hypothetical protein M422DRAFT_275202 [Sphaerobolus stellatus SS14]|uniref:Uncharacterized protein n=1 Tax=Sphaerobolus stellatus (strain SS14) TaxID=990650 RepID=A0A0C9TQ78_SPHS4|nr:hypothetical protein M422DRAFT_275202 [Sphaerobolus stellatus SS14]